MFLFFFFLVIFFEISQFNFNFIQSIKLWAKLASFFFLFSYENVTHCSPCFILKTHVAKILFDFINDIIIEVLFLVFIVSSILLFNNSIKLYFFEILYVIINY